MLSCHVSRVPAGTPHGGRAQYAVSLPKVEASAQATLAAGAARFPAKLAVRQVVDGMQESYVERILKARVYEVAIETPLEEAPRLSRRLGNRVLYKREDLQPVFSFKLRGAYNRIAHLSDTVAARGVICASAGNHAQGVALAARHRGIPAVVVMPRTTPEI